jgi:16S rRNA (cytosine967-C5)-methyltransferase
MSQARTIAARVLTRVWDDAAYAAAALDAELRREAGLDPRDAGLATELVYGVLRTQAYLEGRLDAMTSQRRPLRPTLARAHFLIGAYSIAFLDRVPAFAAVSEAVNGVTLTSDPKAAGFTNAVLRRFAAEIAEGPRPALGDAALASAPGWLRGALRRSLGRAGAAAYLGAGPVPPPIGLCLAPDADRAAWIERLRAAAPDAEIEPGTVSPRAILVRGAGDVRRLPGAETDWVIQEEGAQLVAIALGARPGERVLDACAGRGNKVWALHHDVRPGGAVDAADLYPQKLASLSGGPRGGWADATYTLDWTAGTGDVPAGYDRVLVDAPCSGTGTLRRRPEIGLHRHEDDIPRLAELQRAIVRSAATRVKPGGRLVVAVCSVLREEGEDLVAALVGPPGAAEPGQPSGEPPLRSLEPVPFDAAPAVALAGQATTLKLLPHVQGTDGYFLASFRVL